MAKQTDWQRFWKKVDKGDKPDCCWNWIGGKSNGYGLFCHSATKQLAHRYVLGLTNESAVVLHKCDNPACVNPGHLAVGTQADNMRDMASKGRHKRGGQDGEKHHAAKFTAEDVAAIRGTDAPHSVLARKFGVTPQAIMYVRRNGWKSVATVAVASKSGNKGSAGERNPTSRLTESDIRHIRNEAFTLGELATYYETSKSYLGKIRKRKAWKHVE
jgi:hypothetical protein